MGEAIPVGLEAQGNLKVVTKELVVVRMYHG